MHQSGVTSSSQRTKRMGNRRVLAVAVTGDFEGPWQPAHGNEVAVTARPSDVDGRLYLEVMLMDGNTGFVPVTGDYQLIRGLPLRMFRVVRKGGSKPATVEVILDGKARS